MDKSSKSILAKKEKILDYNLAGTITDEEFLRRNKEYEEQLKENEKRIRELNTISDKSDDELEENLVHIKDVILSYNNIIPDDISKNIVDNLIDKIIVTPTKNMEAKVEFYLKNGKREISEYKKSCSVNIFKKMIEAQERQMSGQ